MIVKHTKEDDYSQYANEKTKVLLWISSKDEAAQLKALTPVVLNLKRGAVRRAAEAEQKECKDEGGLKGMAVPSHWDIWEREAKSSFGSIEEWGPNAGWKWVVMSLLLPLNLNHHPSGDAL